MNEHAIELEEDKQLLFRPIYSIDLVSLETLKTNIEINLTNGFICFSKSLIESPILFDKKLDGGLRLCIDYQSLKNITIKNLYPLPLIGESLDQHGRTKQFTQLNLKNAYHYIKICKGDK